MRLAFGSVLIAIFWALAAGFFTAAAIAEPPKYAAPAVLMFALLAYQLWQIHNRLS